MSTDKNCQHRKVRSSLDLHAGVELVAKEVAQDIEADNGNADGKAGKDHHPGRGVDVGPVQADHRAPGGSGRLDAETQEGERGFEQMKPPTRRLPATSSSGSAFGRMCR